MASAEIENSCKPEFSWGKKRGVGGKKKEVQFYESFTYDGVEYVLYDCVYMQNKDRQAEPYIGKLVKIWKNSDNSKKIKVQWFFRPSEISYWLEKLSVVASENELFLASGDGKGLANVNPLEAIVGKCFVVCVSRDDRNPEPSEEQLRNADYVFYRSFDVGQCSILDKMNDKVGGLEVRFVFNRQENGIDTGPILGSKVKEKDSRISEAYEETLQHLGQQPHEVLESIKEDGNHSHLVAKEDAEAGYLLSKVETFNGHAESFLDHLKPRVGKRSAPLVDQLNGEVTSSISQKNNSADANAATKQVSDSVLPASKGVAGERLECDPPNLDDKSSKREKLDDPVKLTKSKEKINIEQLTPKQVDLKKSSLVSVEEKTKLGPRKDTVGLDKRGKLIKDSNVLDERPSKKLKVQESVKLSEDKDKNYLEKDNSTTSGSKAEGSLAAGSSAEGTGKAILAQSLSRPVKDTKFSEDSGALGDRPSKKLKVQESVKLFEDKDKNSLDRATTSGSNAKGPLFAGSSTEAIGRAKLAQNSNGPEKDTKFNEEPKALEYQPLKKVKDKESKSVKLSEDKSKNNLEKVNITTSGSNEKGFGAGGVIEDKRKATVAQNSALMDDGPSKEKPNGKVNELNKTIAGPDKIHTKEEPGEKMEKLSKSSSKLDKGPPTEMCELKLSENSNDSVGLENGPSMVKPNAKTNLLMKNRSGKGPLEEKLDEKIRPNKGSTKSSNAFVDDKIYGKIFDVTQRPEKGKWFKSPGIFLERMVVAHDEGKLVLLQNLDPSFTSAEVEDIVWSVFKETCTAKVVQGTAISSPFCGRALVIFNSAEVAERAVKELIDGCLIISNQRPVVGCIANLPHLRGKLSTFHGHVSVDEVDKNKTQTRKDKRDAKSSCHSSQPNSVAYDLGTEWCLLQKRSNFSWQKLHKAHQLQYGELMAKFKRNLVRDA
ncbi:protein ANTI-SILENCING 1 isoform X3 [Coffea arabica]|uniref:Protein ANTI-SILENCING 1 isoform X3 n=1 Tax=Coffea arabica TaxID=13443 RepID=A0A6P6TU27_COFAR|nr:protein ANTI-SILENCING 1-like [Coffea arabica]